MATKPRYIPNPGQLVLVSQRAFQARFLLRPSERVNKLIIGVLAKAQEKYAVPCFAPTYLSNHGHLLLQFDNAKQQADFMNFVASNIAREVGRAHRWDGKFWHERFAPSAVAPDEASQISTLRYVLEQGCKENLVLRPQDWPGVHAAKILLSGRNPKGIGVDRTALYEARRRDGGKGKVREVDFEEVVELKISPLPCWAHLSPEEQYRRIADLIGHIEEETKTRHSREGTCPLGRRAVLRRKPDFRPKTAKRSRLPLVRSTRKATRRRYLEMYRIFVAAYRAAAQKLKEGHLDVEFPEGCFPPRRPFVEACGPP